jgi:hypothetical protein
VAGVPNTSELQRILALPRRAPEPPAGAVDLLTEMFKTPAGTKKLWPIQAHALIEAADCAGLFGFVKIGGGKTLISYLAPLAMEAKRPLLLVPAALKHKAIEQDIPETQLHFRLHCGLRIESYDMLSSPRSAFMLDEYKPDLIVLDECQALKNPIATRSKRFTAYLKANPSTRLVAMSGTATTQSLRDYAHLMAHALKEGCPLPRTWVVLEDWDAALGAKAGKDNGTGGTVDGDGWQPAKEPGALMYFCKTGETAREGFRRRLVETAGVVVSMDDNIEGVDLKVTTSKIATPPLIRDALVELRRTWKTAWGEEVESGLALAMHARQLACGFYYRWKWPGGIPDREWLFARSEWHRELRERLKRSTPGLDSPALVGKAIVEGKLESDTYWPWAAIRERHGKKGPPVEAVWLDPFVVRHVVQWMDKHPHGIAWYSYRAVEGALRKMGVPVYGRDDEFPIDPTTHKINVRGSFAASMKSHGTGKNLQWNHHENLIFNCPAGSPSNAALIDQTIGRTHREGQGSPLVTVEVLLHTIELEAAWQTSLRRATYMQETAGPSKMLQGLNYSSAQSAA